MFPEHYGCLASGYQHPALPISEPSLANAMSFTGMALPTVPSLHQRPHGRYLQNEEVPPFLTTQHMQGQQFIPNHAPGMFYYT